MRLVAALSEFAGRLIASRGKMEIDTLFLNRDSFALCLAKASRSDKENRPNPPPRRQPSGSRPKAVTGMRGFGERLTGIQLAKLILFGGKVP